MATISNQYRFLARIIIEAASPLQIGSGEKGIKTDSLVARDVNGLPFIPGTTLAGLIRHSLTETERNELMGTQREGSRLLITEARMLNVEGNVLDGIIDTESLDGATQEFLCNYKQLPIRQHVRIGHQGTAENSGKFDEEIVLKGTRFCFEMELISDKKEESENFIQMLDTIHTPTFRIGSGSRSGFGAIKTIQSLYKPIDLSLSNDLDLYLKKSSSLAAVWEGWASAEDRTNTDALTNHIEGWTVYRLSLKPEDFILFGSGFGDERGDADMTYVKEPYIVWDSNGAIRKERETVLLIPGSSVKGALSHRTAYYYNQLTGAVITADGTLQNGKAINEVVGKNNDAVKSIFGSEGEKDVESRKTIHKQRGNILISDVIQAKGNATAKILNHVSIDRFTGGAIDGALFTEETLYAKGQDITIDILINNQAFKDEKVEKAFESALKDITTGMLPLGGGVNRGNGCFTGTVTKYKKEEQQWQELA